MGDNFFFEVSIWRWKESPYFGVGFGNAKIDIGQGIELSSHNSLNELFFKTVIFGAILWVLLFLINVFIIYFHQT